jgi:hypothetical protein
MPLTRAGISVNLPTRSAPIDLAASFRMNGAGGAAMPSSGWATGAAANFITLPAGRTQGLWMIQVYSAFISTNQTYQFYLHGSNDPAFGAGKRDLLGVYDIAATAALRLAQPAGQDTEYPGLASGTSATIYAIPVGNDRDQFTLTNMNLYVNIAGTTPSITFDSWFSPWSGQKL